MLKNTNQGSTLIEILIALFVFAIIASFSYRAINSLLSAQSVVTSNLDNLYKVQRFMSLVKNDCDTAPIKASADKFTKERPLYCNGFNYFLEKSTIYREKVASKRYNNSSMTYKFIVLDGIKEFNMSSESNKVSSLYKMVLVKDADITYGHIFYDLIKGQKKVSAFLGTIISSNMNIDTALYLVKRNVNTGDTSQIPANY